MKSEPNEDIIKEDEETNTNVINDLPSIGIIKRTMNGEFITNEMKVEIKSYTVDECYNVLLAVKKEFNLMED